MRRPGPASAARESPSAADRRRARALAGPRAAVGTDRPVAAGRARLGVAALAGPRTTPDGLEDFAYGVALRREAGEWRIDLGGVLVGGVRPEPLDRVHGDVRMRADTAAGARVRTFLLWLDGEAVDGRIESPTPFSGRVVAEVGRPPAGRHVAWRSRRRDPAPAPSPGPSASQAEPR